MNLEMEIFAIISHGGDAKATAYKALELAYDGAFNDAEQTLKESQEQLTKAHNTQTKLIQQEINGEEVNMSLLMVHAQDHLMTSISEISLIEQMIKMLQRIQRLEEKI
ncbi:PTS mannose transporter subunit IIA [Virgibacillus pantothenticus]|uniref:PTS mannose transporter subunit IIA n=1 Tax=Virgibacillus pantothenticus TaxID=1473 RepID=A0A0L0QM95_VIRPA|nr:MULTISPECIES: PTS lactose/cellobiose transporter subunit IIA [Virgibacillus]API93399.1 PTS lactose/cellobiose transporter subunit IIA [Virgibacillus sp. 6R]KNE19717.1 PTS mannose transporter subunit IIA [Virgibacillus pantothenticus]MBS7430235.1 PTS lactose/cellobiose transporter subunit IIA [Virgibacillus sp. 19R1-5]MBU8566209.1 PTS lactose/cellobiose transporter subunit IIA [Virgibacillus pantothenticus]MBU8602893.1 PTS lactose/cellobiose transporter subunit IIA [Virgibacillus pantothenti